MPLSSSCSSLSPPPNPKRREKKKKSDYLVSKSISVHLWSLYQTHFRSNLWQYTKTFWVRSLLRLSFFQITKNVESVLWVWIWVIRTWSFFFVRSFLLRRSKRKEKIKRDWGTPFSFSFFSAQIRLYDDDGYSYDFKTSTSEKTREQYITNCLH
jgi:hypothetical protein